MKNRTTACLLIHCKDQKGLVARIAGFIHDFGGNILDSDHHTDQETGEFLMRTVFDLEDFQLPRSDIASACLPSHFTKSRGHSKIPAQNYPTRQQTTSSMLHFLHANQVFQTTVGVGHPDIRHHDCIKIRVVRKSYVFH